MQEYLIDFELETTDDLTTELTQEQWKKFFKTYINYVREFLNRQDSFNKVTGYDSMMNDYFISDKFLDELWKQGIAGKHTKDVDKFVTETYFEHYGEAPACMIEYFNNDYALTNTID